MPHTIDESMPSSLISKLDAPDEERFRDQVRAEQTHTMLDLARTTLDALSNGLTTTSAQLVCEHLLPATEANAVAITGQETIMGYVGEDDVHNPVGGPIRTEATRKVIRDGKMRIIRSYSEIGFPEDTPVISAAIITPLWCGGQIIGSLKFYYPSAEFLTETQVSIATGFGELLSTQLDATALDKQREVATSMELKMLQSQINPHFLFNTINTIASFVRTDPAQARELLREFATFYRRSLEDSSDLIPLGREVEQTKRYLSFEIARFGEDRLQFSTDIPDDLSEYLVPAFLVQPLVENAVRHGMPSEGTLHIQVVARRHEDALTLTISDDGVGMSTDTHERISKPQEDSKGLGFAMRNINERINGYYGPDSKLHVNSELGQGTTVELYLHNACRLD